MKKRFITKCMMNKIINSKSKVEFLWKFWTRLCYSVQLTVIALVSKRYQFDVTDKRILIDSKIVASDRTSKGGVEKSSSRHGSVIG